MFKAFALVSILAQELSEASSDGVITVEEIIGMGIKICKELGLPVDSKGIKI